MIAGRPTRVMLKELVRAGWDRKRSGRGSHSVWQCGSGKHTVTVPDGHRTIRPGVVRQIHNAPQSVRLRQGELMVYEVRITGREGRWWSVEIPSLGGVTQAARLADVETEARDYIAVTLDVAPSTVKTHVVMADTRHARNLQSRSERILSARQQAAALETRAQQETTQLVRELAQDGIPRRDIATLAGISFQRVNQLALSPGHLPPVADQT